MNTTQEGNTMISACNAYPQLVEDRRKLVEALRLICGRDVKAHHWDDTRALLIELGEEA